MSQGIPNETPLDLFQKTNYDKIVLFICWLADIKVCLLKFAPVQVIKPKFRELFARLETFSLY